MGEFDKEPWHSILLYILIRMACFSSSWIESGEGDYC